MTAIKRSFRVVVVALAIAVGLTACGDGTGSKAGDEKIKVGWQYSTQMPLMAVRILGLEGKSGLSIEWTRFDNGPATFPALARGDVDIAHMGAGAAITAIENGLDVTIIGVGQEFTKAEGLIARSGSGISSTGGLKGKRVGVVAGSSGYFGLTKVLESESLKIDDVKVVNMQFAQMVPAFEAGDVDAVYVAEPYRSRILAAGGTQLLSTADLDDVAVSTADTSPWVVRTSFLAEHPGAVAEFIRLNESARQKYESDAEIATRVNEKVASELNMTADQVKTIASFAVFPSLADQSDKSNFFAVAGSKASPYVESLTRLAKLQVDFGSLKAVPDVAGRVDGSVIEAASHAPGKAGNQ
ncbi:NrtA/SsuA/CpmA family ABC transporter substrate-binding protein [Amycolatopsis jejuensis]|uniref:NrtA/SsuA/CpmA family ABC transporter substrate-binding protein n=1 Tax=Amycolatopsis jejuensis TaxID=330084 RepID=UPI0005266069|nr:NrtA/SsuA/CpmA family ABC transporter substrate-binding protein [Amycolatopsis jejuensis]